MAMSPIEKIIKSRPLMWLIFGVYFATFLAVDTVSKIAGDVILIVGVLGIGVAFLWSRPRSGKGSISTRCEKCEASLQGVAGLPRSTCTLCGHRQSWARRR
jgi:hypothetical protein